MSQLKRLAPAHIAIGIGLIALAVRLIPVVVDLWRIGDGHLKLALAHAGFMGIGAISAALVAWLLRFNGRIAMVVGGLFMSLAPMTVHGDRQVILLVPVIALILLALLALQAGTSRFTQLDAMLGILLGAAVAMSLWAIIPAVLIATVLVLEHGLKEGLRLVFRFVAAAGFMVIILLIPDWPDWIGRVWSDVATSAPGYPADWLTLPVPFTAVYLITPVLAILAGVGIRALIRSVGRPIGIGLAAVVLTALAVGTALLP